MNINLNWEDFKSNATARSLLPQWFLKGESYFLYAFDGKLTFECKLDKEESESDDFENNYKDIWNTQLEDRDSSGRSIIRAAATIKGWHYQAHSVQFEVNKLNSTYNKDHNGNDLGFTSIKIYKANGDECTTQLSADTDGVKTVVKWQPNFDFEIISGNMRQLVKETLDSYMYVNAKVATGYPAPYDWATVPFVQGGINLNYIGADEPLRTDGRASKLFLGGTNGDYFEIVINYDANVLTVDNRHKMSLIFEIYKNPI